MSRVGWLWGGSRNAKSAELVDDEDDNQVNDDFLQTQLNAEITSQEASQELPLLQKKKRKSRELSGDGESPKKKRKKRRRKSRSETNDDVGDFSTVLNSVLSYMDGTVGSDHSSPRVERRPEPAARPPPGRFNGPANVFQRFRKDAAVPLSNDHIEPEVSSDDDSNEDIDPSPRHQVIRKLSSNKAETSMKPKNKNIQTLKDSSPSSVPRRSSFATSNKEALLASITKSCSSPSLAAGLGSSQSPVPPPNIARVTQVARISQKSEIPESSEAKEEVQASSPASSPELENEAGGESSDSEASIPEPEKEASVAVSPEVTKHTSREASLESVQRTSPEVNPAVVRESSRQLGPEVASTPTTATKPKRTRKSGASLLWRTASMKATLPVGYTPGPVNQQRRYYCPVTGCVKAYSRKTTMGQHMNIEHAGAKFRDNGDGTLSIVGHQESASDEEEEDIPAARLSKTPPARLLPNRNGSAKKTDTHANDSDETDDSTAPQKSSRGRPKLSNETNGKLVRGGSRRSSRKSISYEEVDTDDDEPPRPRSPSASPPKAILPKRSKPAVPPPDARLSRSESIMEPWEVAPGRIRGSVDSDNSKRAEENIAFSSAYIISNDHGIKLDGINFAVLHLPGGATHTWTSDETALRVCSVAVGKLHVTMGSKDFTIGAHGMWRIRGGEICEVANLNYGEAVVHISTVIEE